MNQLKDLRKKNKYSQRYICEAVGISPKTLYNYEHEVKPIPSDRLIRFAKLFKVSTDYILGIKRYNSAIVTGPDGGVVAVIADREIVEYTGYTITLCED